MFGKKKLRTTEKVYSGSDVEDDEEGTVCGICERECPVVGDRRAVYVTADGETRSGDYQERDRNRSVRLL